jgi:hypothetical protein
LVGQGALAELLAQSVVTKNIAAPLDYKIVMRGARQDRRLWYTVMRFSSQTHGFAALSAIKEPPRPPMGIRRRGG